MGRRLGRGLRIAPFEYGRQLLFEARITLLQLIEALLLRDYDAIQRLHKVFLKRELRLQLD